MTVDHLRKTLQASPFQPFNVRMANGRIFHVPHPDFLSIFPSGRLATVYDTPNTASIVDLLLMTELEILPAIQPRA
jgi:hypothetical protein